ncbi:MAG: hypothetical protein ACRC5A_04855 [Enterobacteriaceae bacterium]
MYTRAVTSSQTVPSDSASQSSVKDMYSRSTEFRRVGTASPSPHDLVRVTISEIPLTPREIRINISRQFKMRVTNASEPLKEKNSSFDDDYAEASFAIYKPTAHLPEHLGLATFW